MSLSSEQLSAAIEALAGASNAALRVAEERAARLVEQSEVPLSPGPVWHILAQLSTNAQLAQLCSIIEEQAGASDAALRVAEEHAVRLVEQPEWVLSDVLLSPDLAPHILAQLPTKAHAAKGTCRAWRRGWKETLEKRALDNLLVFGGYDGEGGFLNLLEQYNPKDETVYVQDVAPMPAHDSDSDAEAFSAPPAPAEEEQARAHFGMAVLDGHRMIGIGLRAREP